MSQCICQAKVHRARLNFKNGKRKNTF